MSGIKPYKGIKLSGTPPTDPKDKINTYNFKVLAKNVKEISNTYVSSSDVTQIIEGDKIFNNLYVTGISAGNVLTVDTCGKIIDSGISVSDLTSGGGSNITLIAGSNVSIVESPDNTYTISVSGELTTNLVDLNDVNISSPVDGQFLVYDSSTSKWINSTLAFSLNGSIDLNTIDQTYTITHSYLDNSVPVVSLVIPISGDTLFVTGISEIGNTSFKVSLSSVPAVSGYKLNYILATDSTTYTSSSQVADISAYLQSQINNKVDNIIGGSGISVIESPTNTFTLNITGNYATNSTVSGISAYLQNQINTIPLSAYTLRTETAAVSGYLNNRINGITSENTVVRGGSGISVVQSPTQTFTVSVSGNYITYVDVASISSSLDNRLDIIEATYITESEVSGISGYLQDQITGITGGGSSTLDGLIDVVLTTPVSGEVLFYDGIKWINKNISSINGISGAAGGDLDGNYPDPVVVQVHGRDKTLTYDGSNNLIYLVDEYGAKSFSYNINGLLVSISGSGRYQSKSFTYDGNDNLIGITIV
jgi:hypothetical protein